MVDPGKVKSIKKKDKALPKEFQINQNNLNDRTVLWDVVPLRHLKQQATTVTIKKYQTLHYKRHRMMLIDIDQEILESTEVCLVCQDATEKKNREALILSFPVD